MIILNDEKIYFILIDGQGGTFGGGRIYESIEELAEQFKEWADMDGYENPNLKDWSISDCISNWTLELKQYNGKDFTEAEEKFINYIIN